MKLPSLHLSLPSFRDNFHHAAQYRSWRWTGYALFLGLFGWLAIWFLFARGLPTADALLAYQPPLPTNVRGYDGEPVIPASTSAAWLMRSGTIRPSWAAAGAPAADRRSPSRSPRI
jgi:hypothetical protein